MLIRILASFILLISILFLPFWISIIFAFLAIIYFTVFWEAIVILLLVDLLYGTKEIKFFEIIFVSSLGATIILILVEMAKNKLGFHLSDPKPYFKNDHENN